MKFELTHQQEQEVRQGHAVEVLDPTTQQAYVVIAREAFDQTRSLLGQAQSLPEVAGIPPELHRSQEAYWRDLPELLKLKSGSQRWVAYHCDERIGLGRTETELYQKCFQRGLGHDEVYVGRLEPSDTPPWGSFQADRSHFEASASAGSDVTGTTV